MFDLFDYDEGFRVTRGNLPHWYQPGVTYFITFRTEDSIPSSVAALWHRRRNEWLCRHGIDPSQSDWNLQLRKLRDAQQNEFHRTFSREYMNSLNKGYGECVLRQPHLAQIVADSLLHFDGDRYDMGDFIVMPNHVHLITCLLKDTDLEAQKYSWRKFMATKINEQLGRKGRFWQEEGFDHLIRSPDEFQYLRRYILQNGKKAGLAPHEYLLRVRDDLL